MPRKKEEINKICGERLRELIDSNNTTQRKLAKMLTYTEQHLNYIVNGKRRLTDTAAKRIAEIFPDIRFEWLLGYDNYRSKGDKQIFELAYQISDDELSLVSIQKLAVTIGYSIVENQFDDLEECDKKLRNIGLEPGNAEWIEAHEEYIRLQEQCRNERFSVYYKGEMLMSCSETDIKFLVEEVKHFIKFRLNELTKQ